MTIAPSLSKKPKTPNLPKLYPDGLIRPVAITSQEQEYLELKPNGIRQTKGCDPTNAAMAGRASDCNLQYPDRDSKFDPLIIPATRKERSEHKYRW